MMSSGEFIGEKIKIISASNKSLIGMEGKIIDETKNTFKVKTSATDRVHMIDKYLGGMSFGAENAAPLCEIYKRSLP